MTKKRQMTNNEIMKTFMRMYKNVLSDRTFQIYRKRLEELLEDKYEITGKSKYLQYKAVLSKLEDLKIEVNVNLPKYSKRGDTVKKNIMDKYVSPDHLQVILNNIPDTSKGEELRRAVSISYYSGLRLEEVLNLNPSDIIINKHIKLNTSGKGALSRQAYIPLEQRELMEDFSGFSISYDYLRKTIQRVSEKIGIKFSFHSLRHSFASNFIKNGGNIALLQKVLGHSNMTTTAIYLHCIDEDEQLKKLGY